MAVDTTSPFRSVKEAIATYGEQFLARKFIPASDLQKADAVDKGGLTVMLPPDGGEIEAAEGDHHIVDVRDGGGGGDSGDYDADGDDDGAEVYHDGDPGDYNSDLIGFSEMLKKLENELQETKFELKLLKKKETETEVALASLNAELHKNMSKVARLEATEASNTNKYATKSPILGRENGGQESRFGEEGGTRDARKNMEDRRTLEQVLSFGVCEGYSANSKKLVKKKPIVPLVTDIFAWKKKSPKAKEKDDLAFLSPLYSSSMYLR